MFHLPDLPNAGYASQREKELSDMVMDFMRQTERDRVRLLTIVVEGKQRWRQVAGDIWRGHRIGEEHELLDTIYDYFTLQAVRPGVQSLLLKHAQNPQKWRDIVRMVMPFVERERDALKLQRKWSPYN